MKVCMSPQCNCGQCKKDYRKGTRSKYGSDKIRRAIRSVRREAKQLLRMGDEPNGRVVIGFANKYTGW